jgi:general secretion pathway protein A
MYCDFYQLTERPFNVTPDPKFLYLNARYREAIASLNYGITQRKGFITLIGEAGTGKTTLLKRLLEDLDAKTKSVFIFNTNVTFEEILEYIFQEFDLPVHNGRKLYMLQRLNTFLLEELRGGGNVALLIDEAQDLEFSVLEDLRLLSNLETAKEKILQIVLSGQPELGQKLSNPVLRQLRQRIGINCRLLPLSRDEITEYIRFRLQAAGCPDLKLFSREAEDQIYHFSRGIPRLVNVVCDNALVIGYALGRRRIGADLITEAAADLLSVEPAAEEVKERPAVVAAPVTAAAAQSRWRARLGVATLVLAAVVVGLLSVGRTMLHKYPDEHAGAPVAPPAFEVIRPGSQPQGAGVGIPAGAGDSLAAGGDVPEPDRGTTRSKPGEASSREVELARPAERVSDVVAPRVEPAAAPQPAISEAVAAADEEPAGAPAVGRRPVVERDVPPRIEDRPLVPQFPERVPGVPQAGLAALPKAAEPNEGSTVLRSRERAPVADDPVARAWQQRAGGERDTPRALETGTLNDRGAGGTSVSASSSTETGGAPRLDGVQFAHQVVRVGDSMSVIARRKYGQATYTILDLMKLANPELNDIDQISVGQTIRLPELGEGFPILNEGGGRYGLLVFSTPVAGRATSLQKTLRSRGFDARVAGGSVGYQKPVFRVVLSGFADRDELVGVGKQLQKLLREDMQVAQPGE